MQVLEHSIPVATMTAQLGFKLLYRHLIFMNFSSPMSEPKPACIVPQACIGIGLAWLAGRPAQCMQVPNSSISRWKLLPGSSLQRERARTERSKIEFYPGLANVIDIAAVQASSCWARVIASAGAFVPL